MKVSLDLHDDYAVVELQEEKFTSLIAPNMKSEVVVLTERGVRNIVFDLRHVKYIDSSGLSTMLMANRLVLGMGGMFVATNLTPTVKQMLEIARLDTVLETLPTLEEAVEAIQLHEVERQIDHNGQAPHGAAPAQRLDDDPASSS